MNQLIHVFDCQNWYSFLFCFVCFVDKKNIAGLTWQKNVIWLASHCSVIIIVYNCTCVGWLMLATTFWVSLATILRFPLTLKLTHARLINTYTYPLMLAFRTKLFASKVAILLVDMKYIIECRIWKGIAFRSNFNKKEYDQMNLEYDCLFLRNADFN